MRNSKELAGTESRRDPSLDIATRLLQPGALYAQEHGALIVSQCNQHPPNKQYFRTTALLRYM